MKYVCFCILLMLFTCCTSVEKGNVWTYAYEEKLYKQLDEQAKTVFPVKEKRRALLEYVIKRYKEELPNGMESISSDSLQQLSVKIGAEYSSLKAENEDAGMTTIKRAWTKDLELNFKKVMSGKLVKNNFRFSDEMCNCVIKKLKLTYPDSAIFPFPKDILQKVSVDCYQQLGHQ